MHCYIFCREILQGELKLPEEMVRVVQIFVIFLHPAMFLDKKLNATLSVTKKNRLVLAGYRMVQTVAVINPLKKLRGSANPLMSSCFAADILCTCQTKPSASLATPSWPVSSVG